MEDCDLAELKRIMWDGFVDVDCTNECGHSDRIEPDGDYVCPECGKGRLVSPLVEAGFV
jgi:ssDNA-binding Zn-finger/Zn-ribbon topoisomerase 1